MAFNNSVFREFYDLHIGKSPIYKLPNKTRDSLDFIQRLQLETKLEVHNGCVNTICWNEQGTRLLSGSDDQNLSIADPFSKNIFATIHSGHRANIFSARFLPNTQDKKVVSCSGDGVIFYTQVDREDTYGQNAFVCHFGTAYEVQTVPQDPNSFLSCGEDGTVRWFDLRIKTQCGKPDCKEDVLINCRRPVTALAVNPVLPWQLSVGCSDSSVRIYDRRMLGTRATGNYSGRGITGMVSRFTAPLLENRAHRITSLSYSPCANDILVSYSSDYIYMFNLKEDGRAQKFETNPIDGTATVTSSQDSSQGSESQEGQRYPPIKRLRLRGDWSDTGPNARPERERAEQERGGSIMQRMSDMLTRLLEGAARGGRSGGDQDQPGEQAPTDPPVPQPPGRPDAPSSSADVQDATDGITAEGSQSMAEVEPAGTSGGRSSEVQALSQTIQEEKVEPVISLQYSCQGTSASTIRVDFASIEVPTDSLPLSQDSLPAVSQPGASAHTAHSDGSKPDVSQAALSPPNVSQSDVSHTQADFSSRSTVCESSKFELGNSTEENTTKAMQTGSACGSNTDGADMEVSPMQSPCRRGNTNEENSHEKAGCSYSSRDSLCDETHEVNQSELCVRESSKNESMTLHLTPQISVEEYVSPDGERLPEDTAAAEGGSTESEPVQSDTEETASEQTVHATGLSHSANTSPRPGASSGKQRRYGHSGPPTGDFQLHSDDNDDDDDSDGELMRAHQRRYSRPTRDENLAARRLQALYRKRQEEKEKEECELRCVHQPALKQIYKGHRNARTMIKEANFWSEKYVMSGSDCGHIFIWDRYSAQLVNLLEADKHVVNCIQPHPSFPILASSGIDYDIKIWMPSADSPTFDRVVADEITQRNEIMLEETRDTITVPASFMLRMLASLNQVRASASNRRDGTPGAPEEDTSSDDDE